MKKLASFIPTHTTSREEVSKYFNKDSSLLFLLNNIDKVFFCFHDIQDIDYCKKIALNIRDNLKQVNFLLYKTPSFNLAFVSHLISLQKEGFTDLIYLPDDSACTTKNTFFIKEVLNYYKKNKDILFLSLTYKNLEFTKNNILPNKTLHLNKKLSLSYFDSKDLRETKFIDFINKPFIANIDLLLKLCDKTYSQLATKQEGDYYLRSQIVKKNNKIALLNKRLIRCFYYNSTNRDVRRKELHIMRKLLQHKKSLV